MRNAKKIGEWIRQQREARARLPGELAEQIDRRAVDIAFYENGTAASAGSRRAVAKIMERAATRESRVSATSSGSAFFPYKLKPRLR